MATKPHKRSWKVVLVAVQLAVKHGSKRSFKHCYDYVVVRLGESRALATAYLGRCATHHQA